MKREVENYATFKEQATEVPGLTEVVERSAMGHLATLQITELVSAAGYTIVPSTLDFLHKCHARLLGSQVVEDGFNVQKNATPTPWQNRRGRIQAAFKALIEKKPLSQKHRFQKLDITWDPACRDMKIPTEAFKAGRAPSCRFRILELVPGRATSVSLSGTGAGGLPCVRGFGPKHVLHV